MTTRFDRQTEAIDAEPTRRKGEVPHVNQATQGTATAARSVGEGFRELDERIDYFIKYKSVQNFGDYLPELICKELLTYPRIDADVFRLIGSVIDDRWARQDLRRANGHLSGLIAYWCCGGRGPAKLSAEVLDHCRFFGVRGPATRDLLDLPSDTVLGDPGLLAPLFHTPRQGAATAGKTVCIPHIHDPKPLDQIKLQSGCDVLVHPEIPGTEEGLRSILDQIASAEFVLTASLHGAIIACAYGRPFAFWDNGHIDVPFKWQDFAGSVNLPAEFVTTLSEGRAFHEDVARPLLTVPPLARILEVAPFLVRPSIMCRALARDGHADADALVRSAQVLDRLNLYSSEEIHCMQDASAANRAWRSNPSIQLRTFAGQALRNGKRRIQAALRR